MDPLIMDFYEAQQGRPVMLNLAIPGWMFDGPERHYPSDPDELDWQYEFGDDVGTQFRDPTFGEAGEYFQRVAEWYVRGGFVDENGSEHHSGHHLKIDYWEVLNEEEEGSGHQIGPETYTSLYDEVVTRLRAVDPTMKFSALALGDSTALHYFEYFLNARNHKPGIPLDMVSYHEYITAESGRTPSEWQHDMFAEADRFQHTVGEIERIRKRLSPNTKTFISEFGVKWGPEIDSIRALLMKSEPYRPTNIPSEYWTLGASVFAYGYLGAMREGVDMVGAAELVDYPGNVAGTNLIDWNSGEPNAVYRVVKLLHDALPAGSRLLQTTVVGDGVEAQGFDGADGMKLLLINKTSRTRKVHVDTDEGYATVVDLTTGSQPPRRIEFTAGEIVLLPHAVMIVRGVSSASVVPRRAGSSRILDQRAPRPPGPPDFSASPR